MPIVLERNYNKREKIADKLNQFLQKMRKRGDLILPAERELCKIMECSRETLRRALEYQEGKGNIVKKGRARTLSMKTATDNKVLGRFAFVANGQGMVGNPAWNKLWNALLAKAEKEKIAAELILIPYNSGKKDMERLLKDAPEILIISTIDSSVVRDLIFSLEGKILITTEEHYGDRVGNLITLDNYEVGRLAAKKLSEHGYKKPALIRYDHFSAKNILYIPFTRRYEGFRDGCAEFGMQFSSKSEFPVETGNHYNRVFQLIKHASSVVKGDFDSVFLYTDDHLPFFYEALSDEQNIPGDIGLITLNSFDVAISHDPPVSSCSHGTAPMANALIDPLKKFFIKGYYDIGRVFVKPDFHEGETLK
jgi:DNA-binding LacI/PurR family transcriptional regulator